MAQEWLIQRSRSTFGGKTEFRESLAQSGRDATTVFDPRTGKYHIRAALLFEPCRDQKRRRWWMLLAIRNARPQICKDESAGIEGSASIAISDIQRWELHSAE